MVAKAHGLEGMAAACVGAIKRFTLSCSKGVPWAVSRQYSREFQALSIALVGQSVPAVAAMAEAERKRRDEDCSKLPWLADAHNDGGIAALKAFVESYLGPLCDGAVQLAADLVSNQPAAMAALVAVLSSSTQHALDQFRGADGTPHVLLGVQRAGGATTGAQSSGTDRFAANKLAECKVGCRVVGLVAEILCCSEDVNPNSKALAMWDAPGSCPAPEGLSASATNVLQRFADLLWAWMGPAGGEQQLGQLAVLLQQPVSPGRLSLARTLLHGMLLVAGRRGGLRDAAIQLHSCQLMPRQVWWRLVTRVAEQRMADMQLSATTLLHHKTSTQPGEHFGNGGEKGQGGGEGGGEGNGHGGWGAKKDKGKGKDAG